MNKKLRRVVVMSNGLTEPAVRADELARQEARLLGGPEVGQEHLLLGLLGEERGVSFRALLATGLTLGRARDLVQGRVARPAAEGSKREEEPELSRGVKRAVRRAQPEAWRLGAAKAGTEHLLLMLLDDPDRTVVRMLAAEGIDPEELESDVRRMVEEGQNDGITAEELREESQRLRRAADALNQAANKSLLRAMLPGLVSALTMGAAVGVGVYTAIRLARERG